MLNNRRRHLASLAYAPAPQPVINAVEYQLPYPEEKRIKNYPHKAVEKTKVQNKKSDCLSYSDLFFSKKDQKTEKNEKEIAAEKIQREAFKQQFNVLIDAFKSWGDRNGCKIPLCQSLDGKIMPSTEKIKMEFFIPAFSETQNQHFFEFIKKYLEDIWSELHNNNLSIDKRKNVFNEVGEIFAVCASGMYTRLEDMMYALYTNISIARWLADLRTTLVKEYAAKHANDKPNIEQGGYGTHVYHFFAQYMQDLGWNLLTKTENIHDIFLDSCQIDETALIKCHKYVVSHFKIERIVSYIAERFIQELISIKNKFGLQTNEHQWMPYEARFIKQVDVLLSELKLPISIDKIFELNDEEQIIRYNSGQFMAEFIRCQQKILFQREPVLALNNPKIYFLHDYLPSSWLEEKNDITENEIKFSIKHSLDEKKWSEIPKENLMTLFVAVVNRIDAKFLGRFVRDIFRLHQFWDTRWALTSDTLPFFIAVINKLNINTDDTSFNSVLFFIDQIHSSHLNLLNHFIRNKVMLLQQVPDYRKWNLIISPYTFYCPEIKEIIDQLPIHQAKKVINEIKFRVSLHTEKTLIEIVMLSLNKNEALDLDMFRWLINKAKPDVNALLLKALACDAYKAAQCLINEFKANAEIINAQRNLALVKGLPRESKTLEKLKENNHGIPKNAFKFHNTNSININHHGAWLFENIYKYSYDKSFSANEKIARENYSIQHAARVAIWVPVLVNLYRRYGDEDAWALELDEINHLMIAALFISAARISDAPGMSRCYKDSALFFYFYAHSVMRIPIENAKQCAEAIANIDINGENWFSLDISDPLEPVWGQLSTLPSRKKILKEILHDANCLDIIRIKYPFKARLLDIYKKHVINISKEPHSERLNEIAHLWMQVKNVIKIQGNPNHLQDEPVRLKYNTHNAFITCLESISPDDHPILFKYSRQILAVERLIQPIIKMHCYDEKNPFSEKSVSVLLEQQMLIYRGIPYPSGIRLKSKRFSLRDNKMIDDSKHANETNARNESRIASSATDVSSNTLEKNNIPNKSGTIPGYGAHLFCPAGLVAFDAQKHINNVEEYFSNGEKKIYYRENKEITAKKLTELKLNIKLGGNSYYHDINIDINEVRFYAYEKNYKAVMFTRGSTLIQVNTKHLHPLSPEILAIFIQQDFALVHGRTLPIFEYKEESNEVKRYDYTHENIIDLWIKVCGDHIKKQLAIPTSSDPYTASMDQIKIDSVYGKDCSNYYAKKLTSPDSNYPEDLRIKLSDRLNTEKKKLIDDHEAKLFQRIKKQELDLKSEEGLFNFLRSHHHSESFKSIIIENNKRQMTSNIFSENKITRKQTLTLFAKQVITRGNTKIAKIISDYDQYSWQSHKKTR